MTISDETNDLDTVLSAMDEQHEMLFAISRDLITAMSEGRGAEVLMEVFDRLREYTKFHFAEEEALMRELRYPGIEQHTKEHAALMRQANTLRDMLRNDGTITPDDASHFIRGWIVNHILHRDTDITAFARTCK